ncbi:Uncharacterised protein [Mycobacteroides abscessus subsp. abscessus]|nr:Uncharacterised protein [Mycobacteroides abscessus subsp. abscessus]
MPWLDSVIGQLSGALDDQHRVFVEKTARSGRDDPGLDQRGQQHLVGTGSRKQVLAAQPGGPGGRKSLTGNTVGVVSIGDGK